MCYFDAFGEKKIEIQFLTLVPKRSGVLQFLVPDPRSVYDCVQTHRRFHSIGSVEEENSCRFHADAYTGNVSVSRV